MTGLFDDPRVAELLGEGLAGAVESAFGSMEIAEEEIAAAGGSRDDQDDPVWKAFSLLLPTHDLMRRTEFVYRAHCRELLARVRAGEDTRPATDAEIVCGISDASHATPLNGPVVGLQMRLFQRTFPEQFQQLDVGIEVDQYERMYGSQIDEWEARLRRKARQDSRRQS